MRPTANSDSGTEDLGVRQGLPVLPQHNPIPTRNIPLPQPRRVLRGGIAPAVNQNFKERSMKKMLVSLALIDVEVQPA